MAYSILIVDDEYVIREGLKHVIEWESLGYYIAGTASSGEETLRFLENMRVDVVLTDVRMPRISGIELARLIKLSYPETKVVILSGYDNFSYAQNAIRHGVYHYLLKPCAEEELLEVFGRLKGEIGRMRERRLTVQRMNKIIVQEEIANILSNKIRQEDASHYAAWRHLHQESVMAIAIVQLLPSEKLFDATLAGASDTYPTYGLPLYDFFDAHINRDDVLVLKFQDDRFVCIIPCVGASNEEYITQMFVDIRSRLTNDLPLDFLNICLFFAAGEAWINLDLKEIVLQADHWFWKGEFGEIKFFQSEIELEQRSAFLLPDSSELAKRFCDQKKSEEAQSSEKIFNSLATVKASSPTLWIQDYIKNLKDAVELCGADFSSIAAFSEKLFPLIRYCATYTRIRRIAIKLGELACQTIYSRIERCYSKNIRDALQLIDQQYRNNINLEELARELSLTSSYLSKLFKREVGVNFKDYLLEKQMFEAKRLLMETNDKVYEIAQAVGFSDQHYFSDVFKRLTTFTPLEYRKVQPDG